MIVAWEKLPELAGKVAMIDGCFDPLHAGHVKYFETAAKLGYTLLCNVQGDHYILKNKNRPNLLPEEQRATLIDALATVSYVHLCQHSTRDTLEQLKPAVYIKGSDWEKRGLPEPEKKVCRDHGIEIVYLDTVIDSSTEIARNFFMKASGQDYRSLVANFEEFVHEQKAVGSERYDDEYFDGEWRAEENRYNIEKRREIEAKNPENIKDVFQPRRALDMGCGPGALMLFLFELGIEVHGVDFSSAARDMAPDEVRDNIHVGSVTEYRDFGVEFDLVICRELLEHLTVLQVRQAVAALARYTTKFLYVTTRFHPEPESLLDVTTEFDVDPTHITCLNKEFLRTLFVLEGLHSRPDLEQKLDWKNYGRVMVFERT